MPSLNALRAFEAAARHESFLRAADELGVTAAAVAQQVRHLEEWAGQTLFNRHSHGVKLSERAAHIAAGLTEAFDSLGAATRRLRAVTSSRELRIAALPCVAQLWLPPRLLRLKREFRDLEISIAALEEPPHLKRDLYDLAIFYACETPADLRSITLSDDTLFPVCSPRLANQDAPLASPSDLAKHTLLHDSSWRDDWKRWLSHAGVKDISPTRGPTFSLYSLALQAAVDCGGVLMGRRELVATALMEGQLIRPFGVELPLRERLTLLVRDDHCLHQPHKDVIEWLQAQGRWSSV
jgi:LysR family transcriptional regulator, glycine cleavage system transcriptional activator